jgi:endopolyphosphatase
MPVTSGHGDLYQTLLHEFSAIPKTSDKVNLDDYAVINVSPPVVPNPYLPTFRIFSYNITRIDNASDIEEDGFSQTTKTQLKRKHGHHRGEHGNKASQCKTEPFKDTWKCRLNETWYSDPDAPSRRNTQWTPLGYAQVHSLTCQVIRYLWIVTVLYSSSRGSEQNPSAQVQA